MQLTRTNGSSWLSINNLLHPLLTNRDISSTAIYFVITASFLCIFITFIIVDRRCSIVVIYIISFAFVYLWSLHIFLCSYRVGWQSHVKVLTLHTHRFIIIAIFIITIFTVKIIKTYIVISIFLLAFDSAVIVRRLYYSFLLFIRCDKVLCIICLVSVIVDIRFWTLYMHFTSWFAKTTFGWHVCCYLIWHSRQNIINIIVYSKCLAAEILLKNNIFYETKCKQKYWIIEQKLCSAKLHATS